jgi:hypothetical protein
MKIQLLNELPNDCIPIYRRQLEKGDILTTCQEVMECMMNLVTRFTERFAGYIISACLL